MAEILDQLLPIAAIVGPDGVRASYSDSQVYNARLGYHEPGWKVEIQAKYRGATINMSEESRALDDAASAALSRLKSALGLP
jgi:hypothetical protein